jgi:LacI family transcriptional regulator
MGYVPDSTAQGLRTRTTKLFGLVIPSNTDPIFARIVLGIEERAHELGYDIMLMHTLNSMEREEVCVRRLLSRRVDGIFIAPVYRMDPEARIYQELLARRTPVVLLGSPASFCNQFAAVQTDDLLGSFSATQHLLNLGHKHIAYFAGPTAAPSAQERFEGYRRALREAGSDVDDRLIFQAGSSVEDGAKAALQMLNEGVKPTAIQAASDLVAIGAADTLLNQGIRVPQDLSIIGFGNILTSEFFRVPLSTIRQPKFRLGTAAVESMMPLLKGEKVESKRLPTELILRASTASPEKENSHAQSSLGTPAA